MKKLFPILVLTVALMLSACGKKSVFGVSTNEDNSISVTGDRGPKDSVGIGYLTVQDGERIVVDATNLSKDSQINLRFMFGVLGSDDFPEEPAFEAVVSGGGTETFDAEPG